MASRVGRRKKGLAPFDLKDDPELTRMLCDALDRYDAMTADEREAMIQQQRESWVRSCVPAKEATNGK